MKKIVDKKKETGFIEVQLGVLVFQDEDNFIAYCPALNLSTYGDTIQDVKEAFDDLIISYLADAEKMGTLESDLIEHGWVLQMNLGKAEPPTEIDFNLNIPAGMLKKQYNEMFKIPTHFC